MASSVGIDLIAAVDVAEAVRAHGRRYLERIYTAAEIAECSAGGEPCPRRLAARFAAKEAVLKALGTSDQPIDWRSVEVLGAGRGAMTVTLREAAASMASTAEMRSVAVSFSTAGERSLAVAVVHTQT